MFFVRIILNWIRTIWKFLVSILTFFGAIFTLVTLFVIGVTIYVWPFEKDVNFDTCPVCGYYAQKQSNMTCRVCEVCFTDSARVALGYESLSEMHREEQLIYFARQAKNGEVDFYHPQTVQGMFMKMDSWEPIVSEDSVRIFVNYLLKKHPELLLDVVPE